MPKCGGSSIDEAILKWYPDWAVFSLPAAASARAASLAGREVLDFRRDLLLFAFSRQKDGGYIRGHFPFSLAAWTEFHDRWKFITILRHPVDRWFSNYFFNRFRDHGHSMIRGDLEEFLDTPRAADEGCMFVRLLSERPAAEGRTPNAVAAAIANLERFHMVGLLEQLPDFVSRIHQTFGIALAIGKRNQSPLAKSSQRELITPEILSRVEALCEPDLQVHQRAAEIANSVVTA